MRPLLLPMILIAAPASSLTMPEISHQALEFPPPVYTQRFEVEFASDAAAAAATFAVMPLFENYPRAISCRWDDNLPAENLAARELMEKHGIRGTWYLNSDSAPYMKGQSLRPVAHHLLRGGNSIGCHSAAHPYTTAVNRNRQFEEFLAQRVEWEAELDTLINSYATAYVDFRNPIEGDQSQADLILNLERAGLYHAAEFIGFHQELPSDLELSIIMPPENQEFDLFRRGVDWAMGDATVGQLFPCVSNSMHPWYRQGDIQHAHYTYDITELERRLEYLAALKDVWHTNQNAYAAYRKQYRHHRINVVARRAATVTVELTRPELTYLNDAAPLTIGIGSISAGAIVATRCTTASITPAGRYEQGKGLLNISHDDDRSLPTRIDVIANEGNSRTLGLSQTARDFPGVLAGLSIDAQNRLLVQVENQSALPIGPVAITWRNPLAWKQGIHYVKAAAVESGGGLQSELILEPSGRDAQYQSDLSYFVAQLDFEFAGQQSRLYLTCHRDNPVDASLPKNGFLVQGPIPRDQVELSRVVPVLTSGGSYTLGDGSALAWRVNETDGPIQQSHLSAETIRTQGTWYELHSPGYLLASIVSSPVARRVRLLCHEPASPVIVLNGRIVESFEAELVPGPNDLRLLYFPPEVTGTGRNAAAFLRIVDAATGVRLQDISYRRSGGAISP